jgi:hypothetical protein
MRTAVGTACIGLVLCGCVADPELARYQGGGGARSRLTWKVSRVARTAGDVAGPVVVTGAQMALALGWAVVAGAAGCAMPPMDEAFVVPVW